MGKDSKCFNSHDDWNRHSNEAEFHNTLKNGEFFEKWHYQDQRLWRLEQCCMEMANRMNFSDMEMQMDSWMNSHERNWNSMSGMRISWMESKRQLYGSGF